jgi:anti-anti-sigma factor
VTLSQRPAPDPTDDCSVLDPEDPTAGLTVAPTQPRRGLVLVRVLGEVDMLTADRLADVLDGALAAVAAHRDTGTGTTTGETPSVVCDLGGVTFFGASGLDVFATAQQTAVTRGVRLVVVAEHRTVVRPFSLTALDRSLTLVGTHPALGRHAADAGERR